ncbi:M48 family peptidase [Bacillus sp. HMF5848]|nr:M48 family peptidase [Bacillus sp. HMF5848]
MWADTSLPENYIGSAADPQTFMTERELFISEQYSKIRDVLFFITIPFEWLMYFAILVFGLSDRFQKWAGAITRSFIPQGVIYFFWLSLAVTLVTFPLSYLRYWLSKSYDITVQSFSSWMRDYIIDFWVNYAIMAAVVVVLYWLIKKSRKRWWLYGWLLSIPFTLFMTFINPVVIDPLYNDFYPLKDKELEAKILAIADTANIPAEHVFEVNMSTKTNAMNAYVTGIGSNARIVLWDTTLNKLSEDEVLFIMAHEMAHWVMKHVLYGTIGYMFVTLLGLFTIHLLFARVCRVFSIEDVVEWRSLPVFLLLISILSFSFSPISNAVSRHEELAADRYAIEITGNQSAAVTSFQALAKTSLRQVNPPYIVKLFRYAHPTMMERLYFLENYKRETTE